MSLPPHQLTSPRVGEAWFYSTPDHHPLHQLRLVGGLVTDNNKPLDAYSGLLLSVTYWVNMFDALYLLFLNV
jgi:hypothetical protein